MQPLTEGELAHIESQCNGFGTISRLLATIRAEQQRNRELSEVLSLVKSINLSHGITLSQIGRAHV